MARGDNKRGPAPDSVWRQIGEYTGLAVMLPAAALIGFGIGYALDAHFGHGQLFRVLGLLLGAAAGLIEIVRVSTRQDGR